MITFLPRPMSKVEAVEDLERPALQSVGLTVEDFGAALVYDAGVKAEARTPEGGHQTCRSSTNDEKVDMRGIPGD